MYHAAVAFTHDIVQPLRQEKLSVKQVLLLAKNGTGQSINGGRVPRRSSGAFDLQQRPGKEEIKNGRAINPPGFHTRALESVREINE